MIENASLLRSCGTELHGLPLGYVLTFSDKPCTWRSESKVCVRYSGWSPIFKNGNEYLFMI